VEPIANYCPFFSKMRMIIRLYKVFATIKHNSFKKQRLGWGKSNATTKEKKKT
jgi:hypothetical protein